MKKDSKTEIKNMDVATLIKNIKDTNVVLEDLILDKNMNKLKDLKSVFKKRKELAVMQTVLRQKNMLAELELKKEGGKQVKVVSKSRTKSVQKKK